MRKLFLLGLITLLIVSCENTDPNPGIDGPVVTPEPDYFPFTIGSSWVYQTVIIDTLGHETIRDVIDSIFVSKDTLIKGILYYVFEGSNYPINGGNWGIVDILRDSMGYIVNQHGEVKLSFENFTDTLHVKKEKHQDQLLYTLSFKMEREDVHIGVPAGSFQVINCKGTLISALENESIPNPRYLNNLYADGVGNVLKTYLYLSSPNIIEKRLLRYTIQE